MPTPSTAISPDEYDENSTKIGLYGAAAVSMPKEKKVPLKTKTRAIRDQLMLRGGFPIWLDYRNYLTEATYNRGDKAIIDAMEVKLASLTSLKNIIRINWDQISKARLTPNDKLLICGSGYIFPNKKGQLPARIFRDAAEIIHKKLELHLIGAGLNHLIDWNNPDIKLESDSEKLLAQLLEHAQTVTVRDSASARFLQRYTRKDVKIIGDPALYLTTPAGSAANRGYRRHKIGLSVPFHGIEPTIWIKKNFSNLAGYLKRLKHSTSSEIHYFIHYDTEVTIAKALASMGAVDTIIDGSTTELMAAYGDLDFHVGGMLHSCILATAAGTPSIGLAYDIKHHGFFELMNRSSYCINASSIQFQDLEFLSLQLAENLQTEQSAIASRVSELTKVFDSTLVSIMNNYTY